MKKKPPGTVAEALDRLTRAIKRLEAGARDVPELHKLKLGHQVLTAKLADVARDNSILREAATRVATKIDGQISRLSSALKS